MDKWDFFYALPEFVVSFKLAHLPNAVMWPCGLIGKVWSCELQFNTSAHPSYAGLFFCNMKQGWTWLFLYVWIILRFSFRSGQDWGFRTKVHNSSFKAKKGHGVGRGLICIHTCTYERVYLYVHTFRTGNCICKLDLVILCNKICSIKSNPVRVCVRKREWSDACVNLQKLAEYKWY